MLSRRPRCPNRRAINSTRARTTSGETLYAARFFGYTGAVKTLKTLPAVLLVLSLLGCLPFGASSPLPLKSADGRSQITLPAGWKADRALHATADIAA
jgi:hypothetical protein